MNSDFVKWLAQPYDDNVDNYTQCSHWIDNLIHKLKSKSKWSESLLNGNKLNRHHAMVTMKISNEDALRLNLMMIFYLSSELPNKNDNITVPDVASLIAYKNCEQKEFEVVMKKLNMSDNNRNKMKN